MNRDSASILDAYRFAQLILQFTSGMNKNDFLSDIKTQAAVIYEITLLGEAFKRLSQDFRSQYPEIPYSQIIGMRNKLTHDYDGIDLDIVWKAVNKDIPELLLLIEPLLPPS
ncbi:MAG TPA: DUF86 domain-containing protein [Allocoleopsis sp.]